MESAVRSRIMQDWFDRLHEGEKKKIWEAYKAIATPAPAKNKYFLTPEEIEIMKTMSPKEKKKYLKSLLDGRGK